MANGFNQGFSPDTLSLFNAGIQQQPMQQIQGVQGFDAAQFGAGMGQAPNAAPALGAVQGLSPEVLQATEGLPTPEAPQVANRPDAPNAAALQQVLAQAQGGPDLAELEDPQKRKERAGKRTMAGAAGLVGNVGAVATLNPLGIASAVATLPGNIINLVKGIGGLFSKEDKGIPFS